MAVSMQNSVAVPIRKPMPKDQTLLDVRAMRSSLDAVQMVLLRPRDHTIMVVTVHTVSSSAVRMGKHRPKDRTSRAAPVLPASLDAVRMESMKPRVVSLRVARSCRSRRRRPVCSRRIWERVTTTPSSTSSTWNMAVVEGSGTVDAMETRIVSIRLRIVRMCVRRRTVRIGVSCQRSPGLALDTIRCGTTIRIGTPALSSLTVDVWAMPIGSRRLRNARDLAWRMTRSVSG